MHSDPAVLVQAAKHSSNKALLFIERRVFAQTHPLDQTEVTIFCRCGTISFKHTGGKHTRSRVWQGLPVQMHHWEQQLGPAYGVKPHIVSIHYTAGREDHASQRACATVVCLFMCPCKGLLLLS